MKRLLLLTAAAALLAAPVFAQAQQQAPKPKATTGQSTAPKAAPGHGANDVWCGSEYVGSDPDPAIRLQMLREWHGRGCNQ